jgi:hypothetical protein
MSHDDQTLEDAKRVLREDYWSSVRSFAEEIEQEVKDGRIKTEDDLTERLDETVDGSYWVAYPHATLQVLCWTEHDDAIEEVYGSELEIGDGGITGLYTQIAYFAMRADIQSYISSKHH